MRTDILERKEEILKWIDEELTLFEIKVRLNCKYETLRRYLKEMGITYAGQQARKGQQKGPNKYKSSEHYTKEGAPYIASHKLKQKLIRDGIKSNACELCGASVWLDKQLPLELHHKDGNHYNNCLDNLQILCPNCHAVVAPNSGAAVGNYTKKTKADKNFKTLKREVITEDLWLARKQLILTSGVDFTKLGWKTKVQEVTGLTRRQVDNTILRYPEDFSRDKFFIRK